MQRAMSEPVNVLITLPFTEAIIAKLEGVSARLKIDVTRARKVEDISDNLWAGVEVLYTNRLLPSPEQAPKLRWIQFHWAGVDHVVDAPILRQPKVVATTLSGANASQISEYVLMMLLSLGHRMPDLFTHQRRGDWPKDRWERFSPLELRGSTVGIIGYGSIGRQVARLLQPFGARVLATKRNAMHPEDNGYAPEGMGDPGGDQVYRLYPPEAVRSMLRECDFGVVTVPLTPDTRGMIGAEELAALRSTAFLIDVSRGGVVDHAALVAALKDHKIAGAALDVYPEEPLPADSPLWKLSNVILTPHIAGNTQFYDERAADLFAENLQRYLAGQTLLNRFDPERGY